MALPPEKTVASEQLRGRVRGLRVWDVWVFWGGRVVWWTRTDYGRLRNM